jgi:hypothetical protein
MQRLLALLGLSRGQKVGPTKSASDERAQRRRQSLSTTYVEHHLTLEELRDVYHDSLIDTESPERSDGLSSVEARKRLKDGGSIWLRPIICDSSLTGPFPGANVMRMPKRISNIRLFFRQFLYQFWLLLMGELYWPTTDIDQSCLCI